MSKPFHLPFLPRSDRVMTQMPVLRVLVKTDHPENFTKETAFAAAERELSRQQPKILNYYQAQQANSQVSGLDLSKTHMVSDGIELRHTNLNGTPILEITINVDALEGQPCMMVLHSGNKITAFDMKSVDNGKLSKVYAASLSQSSWGAEPLLTTQYRYSKTETVVYAFITVSGTTISANDALCVSRTVDKTVARTLTQSVPSRTTRAGSVHDLAASPIITNNGTTFYTPYDVFSIAPSGITRTGDLAAALNPYYDDPAYPRPYGDIVYGLDRQGNYYSTPIYIGYFFTPFFTGIHGSASTFDNDYRPVGATQTVYGLTRGLFPDYSTLSNDYIGYYKNTTPVADVAYTNFRASGDYTSYYVKSTMSTRVPHMTYLSADGLDIIDASASQIELTMSGTYDWLYNLAGLYCAASFGGVTVTASDRRGDPDQQILISSWPPAYNGQPYLAVATWPFGAPGTASLTLHTPYGQIEAASSIGYFAVNNGWGFTGRLHASNGAHVLQGFSWGSDTRYYLDGNDVGAKLATLCGCAVGDIQSILLDIPLARIKQFK